MTIAIYRASICQNPDCITKETPQVIDSSGNHVGGGCTKTYKGRYLTHSLINNVITFLGRYAGFVAEREPDTKMLVGGALNDNQIKIKVFSRRRLSKEADKQTQGSSTDWIV